MSLTYQTTRSINDGTAVLSKVMNTTVDGDVRVNGAVITAGATNTAVSIAFAVANLKCFFMLSDQDLTIKTNSTSSPQETISLIANRPLEWTAADGYFANPFAGNVSVIYATNAGASDATLEIRAGVDATP